MRKSILQGFNYSEKIYTFTVFGNHPFYVNHGVLNYIAQKLEQQFLGTHLMFKLMEEPKRKGQSSPWAGIIAYKSQLVTFQRNPLQNFQVSHSETFMP